MRKTYLALPAFAATVLFAGTTLPALAQAVATTAQKPLTRTEFVEHFERDSVDRTYQLHYGASQAEQNEILTALRNIVDPITRILLVPGNATIVVHAPEETQTTVANLLTVLDRPHPRYRLTYTMTELDGSRKVGVQHFSMVLLSGQREQMKQGSRIPISAGEAQFTYIDVGMNFDATLTEIQGGAVLKTKVEQTSMAPDSTTATNPNPLLRQTQLEGTTSLVTGKPLLLGSLDVPSSTRHFDIEVLLEPAN